MKKIVTITLSEASWIEGGGSLSFLTPKTLFIFLFFFLFLHRRKNGAIRRRLTSRDEKRRRNVEEKPSKKRNWFQWKIAMRISLSLLSLFLGSFREERRRPMEKYSPVADPMLIRNQRQCNWADYLFAITKRFLFDAPSFIYIFRSWKVNLRYYPGLFG